jgi:hypothetical protein
VELAENEPEEPGHAPRQKEEKAEDNASSSQEKETVSAEEPQQKNLQPNEPIEPTPVLESANALATENTGQPESAAPKDVVELDNVFETKNTAECAAAIEEPSQPEQEAPKEEPVSAPAPESQDPSEVTPQDKELPILEVAAGVAVGAVAAAALASQDHHEEPEAQLSERAIVDEPEGLEEVIEEDVSGGPPSPEPSKHRKHRSSKHSKTSSRTLSSREGPTDDGRPPLHRRRRESENSLKNMFFGTTPPTSPKKPSRHDSGVSAGSTSPHSRKHRSDRTPEEQAAHEMRKAARAAEKLKAAESGSGVANESAPLEIGSSSIPIRRSSTRRHSSSRSSGPRDGEEKKPKLLDMKGESVVKSKLLVTEKPHVKEELRRSDSQKIPIIDRPRFSMDGERPKHLEQSSATRHHNSHHHSSSRKVREERDRHRSEEERELKKAREETRRQVEHARAEADEVSRRQQERDDEERRLRREVRRKRREEEERAAERSQDSPEASVTGPKGRLVKERPRQHQSSRSAREKEKERSKSKGPLKSLWSSAKKVFN